MEGMLEQMSSSQLAHWAAYFRSLSGAPKRERVVGSGKMRVSDWKRMSEAEKLQAQKRIYNMFRSYAAASGGKKNA